MMKYVTEAEGLVVHRAGQPVLHGPSFAVRAGTVTGLLGPSGCGKTTLMRAVVGVQRGVRGELRVLGLPAGSAELRARIGYVTQAPAVYTDLTVAENLRYFAAVRRADDDVERVPAAVDLAGFAGTRVDRLSGGQQARVSLATALLGEPELLVLDEPTVGLDPVLRRDLWVLFSRLAAEGTTVLVSSHVMDEAERCEELLLLRDGKLLAADSPQALLRRTGTLDVEAAFLHLIESLETEAVA